MTPIRHHASSAALFLALSLIETGYGFVIAPRKAVTCHDACKQSPSSLSSQQPDSFTDDEWHPRDPAHTTPQLLAGVWHQIAQAGSMVRGETLTVIYPELEEELNQQPPRYLNNIMAHLDHCKDVCDHFGMTTTLTPFLEKGTNKIVGFTAKSFKNPKKTNSDGSGSDDDDDDEFNFGYDPFWDDGTDFEALYSGIDDDDMPKDPYPEIVNKVPDDDEKIIDITKEWVQALMSDMGVCPFSPSADLSGLPVGPVHYEVDRSSTVEDMYVKYWEEVVRVEQNPEKDLSTTLLITPEFFMDNVELFETFCNTLTQPLTALKVEDLLQLVFFHPHWSFRDGGERATSQGQAANYARRSPWPMINILRTKQVRAAQKGIPTGLVYKQNEKTLNQIGVDDLETMLRLRDWTDLDDKKVNRKDVDALKIAQDFQQTGTVRDSDKNLANDATPVANRVVDRKQVEDGDLVKVLQQALEKRLDGSGDDAPGGAPLSGPETSVTSMATEYLLQELDKIAAATATSQPSASKPTTQTQTAPVAATPTAPATQASAPSELEAARKAHLEKARQMLMADLVGEDDEPAGGNTRGNEMTDVYFGRGGVQARSDDDDDIDAFNSFQGR